MTNNTQLPAEMADAINQFVEDKTKAEREHWNKAAGDPDRTSTYIAGYEHGVRKGATEYASKLLASDKANSVLEENNRGLNETLNEARQHLESVLLYISGTSPIHDKIQTFLDGTK